MLRILLISHALIEETSQARWRQLARANGGNIQIRVLVPEEFESTWFGNLTRFSGAAFSEANYEVCPCPVTDLQRWWKYRIRNLAAHLREFRPDFIYCIHEEYIRQLHDTIIQRWLHSPRAKLIYFSMRALPRVPPVGARPKSWLKHIYFRLLWWHICRGTNAAVCHYPGIRRQMEIEGYRKPILVQTQLGIDPSVFYPDPEARRLVRTELGLSGFVVGMCGRLEECKGVWDILSACLTLSADWQLVMIGDGPERERIEKWANEKGIGDRVRLTGQVPRSRVPVLLRALDCFVMASRSTKEWVDTFPLALVQAMATRLPVIGSDSGGLPFILGESGLVFPEGDSRALARHLATLQQDESKRFALGASAQLRAEEQFSVEAINDQLLAFLSRVKVKQT